MQDQKITKQSVQVAALIILAGALSRFIPHPYNFTPIGAMALFGGATIGRKWLAYIIPVSALLLSNVLFEIQESGTGFTAQLIWVYGSMLLITRLGMWLSTKQLKQNLIPASLAGSVLFFLLTNFGVWAAGFYGPGLSNLLNCYVAGIPFFGGTLLGDLCYNGVFFGAYALYQKKATQAIIR